MNLIYARVIGLQDSSRTIDFQNVLMHELAPIPTSMFMDDGEMRISKANLFGKKNSYCKLKCHRELQLRPKLQ